MSQQEFENYLALLTRLLRIDPKQREQVASEFRSHLEDRLDELLERGVARETAIQTALEEFGDAAALAAEYVALSRNRKRRLIMRLTTASVAASVLIAAAIFTFWPGTNAGPGPAATVAQDTDNKAPGVPGKAPATRAPALDDKLSKRIDAEFIDTPLKDVLAYLHDTTGISFYVKKKRLQDAGVEIDVPVNISLQAIRVSTLLDLVLEELGLVYTEKDELIIITTAEDADATMEVRVYDCRDLIAMPASARGRAGGSGGMEMMMPGGGSFGFPGSGYGSGGYPGAPAASPPGAAAPSDYGSEGDYGGGGSRPGRRGSRPAVPDVPDGADSPDAGSAAPPGTRTPPPPTRRAPGRAPGDAPAGADPFGASVPNIVPPESGDDVLGQIGDGGMPGMPGMMPGMEGGFSDNRPRRPLTEHDQKAEQLMDILVTAVDPASWSDQGGPGTIGQYNGLIVVSQSARTHTKIEKVLEMLREAAGRPQSPRNPVVR